MGDGGFMKEAALGRALSRAYAEGVLTAIENVGRAAARPGEPMPCPVYGPPLPVAPPAVPIAELSAWTQNGMRKSVGIGTTTPSLQSFSTRASCPACAAALHVRSVIVRVELNQATGDPSDWSACEFRMDTDCRGCKAEVQINAPLLTTLGRLVARVALNVELDKNKWAVFEAAERKRGIAAPARVARAKKPKPAAPPVDVDRELDRFGAALAELDEP